MTKITRMATVVVMAVALAFPFAVSAQDYAAPGTCESVLADAGLCGASAGKTAAINSLTPYVTESGNISVSMDALGTSSSGLLQVQKPSNAATVRGAYLMTASTGFSGPILSNVTITRGANTVTVAPADYDQKVPSSISSQNGIIDLTAFFANDLDTEPAGTYDYTVAESSAGGLDGEAVVVIFNDPAAPTGTFVLAFGAQTTTGDNFAVTLGSAFDDATVDITMSLGISFGFQPAGQFSTVDVNGQRLTSSAGGQDDGFASNGALITIGGIGDDPANPADPNATDSGGPRTDDELYTIDPFLNDGDTQINIATRNPSNDDNMFFAGFLIRGTAAVIGEGILLTPPDDTNPINTNHTVTAFLQDDAGDPVSGRDVQFEIISGPNAGLTATVATDASGEAEFTWSSTVVGTDVVRASFVASNQQTLSTTASKTWVEDGGACDVPRIVSETVNNTDRTITIVYADDEGIVSIAYRYPADFPDAAKAGQPSLVNLSVIDDGGMSSGNGIDFTASSPYPTTVTHVLQAPGPGRAVYFPIITDACEDPEAQVYDADPVHSFEAELPAGLTLEGNYPNPFNPSTLIRFALPEEMEVSVSVYDLTGRRVATLVESTTLSAGAHELRFEAGTLSSGMYLYKVQAGGEVHVGRMTLLK